MFARLSAFVIWSLVGATAAFWALRLAARPPQVPPYALAVGNAATVRGDLGRLFGTAPRQSGAVAQAPEAPSRFKLLGVMAPRGDAQAEPGHGVALIAVDGKPPKPFTVGAQLDGDLVLQSVSLRTASLGPAQGARSVLLELPALPPPNSGVLPPLGAGPALAAPPRAPLPIPGAALPPLVGTARPANAPDAPPVIPGQSPPGLPTPGGLATQ
jgi:general secretion pathway protein C